MDNQISLILCIFFILIGFIGILRKPIVCVTLLFIGQDIVTTLFPNFDNHTIIFIICGVLAVMSAYAMIKFRGFFGFLFGFSIMYMTFFHVAGLIDLIAHYIGIDNITFFTKLINNDLFINTVIIQVIFSCMIGGLLLVFNKRTLEFTSAFLGSFASIIFAIDVFRNTSSTLTIDSAFFANFSIISNEFIIKNVEVYSNTVHTLTYFNLLFPLTLAIIIASITLFIKKNKYEYI